MAKRTSHRSLNFESLEIRTSLTSAGTSCGLDADVATTISETTRHANDELLHYVATLRDIALHMDLPSEQEAQMADRLLATPPPGNPDA